VKSGGVLLKVVEIKEKKEKGTSPEKLHWCVVSEKNKRVLRVLARAQSRNLKS
jgi:hypothetical protein